MSDPRSPRTEAGRTFLSALQVMDRLDDVARATPVDWAHGIFAIEAEAIEPYSGLIDTMHRAAAEGFIVHIATRATCTEHLEHGDDKATEALTAANFDADRLARAMAVVWPTSFRGFETESEEAKNLLRDYAGRIIRALDS